MAIDRRIALGVAGTCWFSALVIALLALTDRTIEFDRYGLHFWRGPLPHLAPAAPLFVQEMVRDLSSLGGVLLRNLIALGAVTGLLLAGSRREAITLASIVASGWLLSSGMKVLIGRDRPEIVPHLTEVAGASFPSGHSFNSAVVLIAVALTWSVLCERRLTRVILIGFSIGLSLAVAWTRVWLGVHYPSDVMAGWLGGAGLAIMAFALLNPGQARRGPASSPCL